MELGHRGAIGSSLMDEEFTCVATCKGLVSVAFVTKARARTCQLRLSEWPSVGWRARRTVQAGCLCDGLERAVHGRRPGKGAGLVHPSDAGSQSLPVGYTERLGQCGHRSLRQH